MNSIPAMTKPYQVALRHAARIPPANRIAAEVRFAAELERIYGGDIAQLMAEMHESREGWKAALDRAASEGLHELEDPEAFFEVRSTPP